MDTVARLDAEERRLLFEQTAARIGFTPDIAEKDFWVCWMLKRVFDLPETHPRLLFKGGTTLSKVFGLISRFSEDIDLSVNRQDLGFEGDNDPANIEGTNERRRALKALRRRSHSYIASDLLPSLTDSFAEHLRADQAWALGLDPSDPEVVHFTYPQSGDESWEPNDYLAQVIKLEIAATADHWPASDRAIRPYAADEFPQYFDHAECSVRVLEVVRTFWEKATILHSLFHGGPEKVKRGRGPKSRHYYDLVKLARSPTCDEFLAQIELLEKVADHKDCFFRAAWARYAEARPGSLRLAPSEEITSLLQQDYREMQIMIFDDSPPTFEELVEELRDLEDRINAKA